MEDKKIKIEGEAGSAQPAQPDARTLAMRKWCPCIAIVAMIFVFMIIGGILGLRAYFANSEPKKDMEIPIPDAQTTPDSDTKSKTSPKKTNPDTKSTPTADNSAANKEKMINFFVETAVIDDDKARELYVIRWNKPSVSAGVAVGTFDDHLNGCLDGFISDFNALTSGVDLFHDNTVDLGIPNIKIFYLDEATFNARAGGSSQYGYVQWDLHDDYSINRISMNISYKIKEMEPGVQCQIIRHEMMHAVGFWGHSDIYPQSIMSLPKTVYSYPAEDKWLVELLYNIGLPLGSNPAATREFLNANYPF